ncbi:MAG: polysaccharide deacetylase, partial [Pseudomonadota bacterium]
LRDAGYLGVSSMWARPQGTGDPEFMQVNTHLDPVHWPNGVGFVGRYRALGQILKHLYAKRTGRREFDEPTGLLTHHLVQDDEVWDFCEALLQTLSEHPAVQWTDARKIWKGLR